MAIRDNRHSGNPRLWCHAALVGFVGLAMMIALTVPGAAQPNRIESVSIVSEAADTVTFEVVYQYTGDQGRDVSISVDMAQNGERPPYYGYRPGPVRRGRHRTRVALDVSERAPDLFSTNQVQIGMFVPGRAPFLSRTYAFAKTWSRPRAGLTAVPSTAALPQIVGNVGVLVANPQIGEIQSVQAGDPPGGIGDLSGGSSHCDAFGGFDGVPERRVLSDGSIELTYPSGKVRVRSRGMVVITCPDGTTATLMQDNAQPPTPPSAPPDATHAAWVQVELERQLEVIRMLVGYDVPSVDHYLAQESPALSAYGRISQRTLAIDMLVRP